ncbi:MAG TPA: hypothetical protein VKZ93_03150 [Arenibacter sp.]|nr:hypothetical protein [Arenibacter sp.]
MDFLFVNLIALIIGVASGVLASYIFLTKYLKNKVPNIKISNFVSLREFQGEWNYFLKFVNHTDCEIFDVRVELTLYKPIGDINGTNLQGKDVVLKDNFFSYLSKSDLNDERNLHALRVRTTTDILGMWDDQSSFLRLTVIARHSLSGLNKVFVKDYKSKDLIVKKKFMSGDDLSVYNGNI